MSNKAVGLMTFQENIWMIINSSLNMAIKKANASNIFECYTKQKDKEVEDLNYQIEWVKVIIRGKEEDEKSEYDDCMKLYGNIEKHMKDEIPKDSIMAKHFKSKVLSPMKVDEAYSKGYGAAGNSNLSNKLLEMGVLTHIEWIKDFDGREPIIKK